MAADTNNLYASMTHRTAMVLGSAAMERLAAARVIVVGVGGVGSWCAEALVRSGLVHLALVDSDIICPTNLNRQLQATSRNLGESKVREIRERLLSINPAADIVAHHRVFDETTADDFDLAAFDYVIDAIDSIANKALLIERCVAAGVTVFCSMGAAAKTDPTRVRVAPLSKTHGDPLARVVRRRLRARGVGLDGSCVFSDEPAADPAIETICGTGGCECVHDRDAWNESTGEEAADWCAMKKRVNGALVHVTGVFGFTLASMVIRDIMRRAE
ncbi:MAG TPA: ThiF family adenylyltransferase [Spirochaetota bacterium]|nr:ThiF family adenylyltransferase [Spirochaetota bacterium]